MKQRRQELGLTQEELAEKMNVSTLTVRYVETGMRAPSFAMLVCLTRHLKINIRYESHRLKRGQSRK